MSKFVSCLETSDPFASIAMDIAMVSESFQMPVTEGLKEIKDTIMEKAKHLWERICEWVDTIKEKVTDFLAKLPAFKDREIEGLIFHPNDLGILDRLADSIDKVANQAALAYDRANSDVLREGLKLLEDAVQRVEKLQDAKRIKVKANYVQVKKWCLQLQAKVFAMKNRTKDVIAVWKRISVYKDSTATMIFNKQAVALTLIVGVLNHDLSVLRTVSLRAAKEKVDIPLTKQEKAKYAALPAGSGA